VNNIGGYDFDTAKAACTAYGLTPSNGLASFGLGIDAAGASSWYGWDGSGGKPRGFEVAALAMQDNRQVPYLTKNWVPYAFAALPNISKCVM